MKSMKSLVRVAAVILLAVFTAGLVACSSYNTNPTVATVGGVKIDLKRFNSLYFNTDSSSNPYYSYMQQGYISRDQYANYIIEDLVNYGVQMDQIQKQNITLDETEEAEVQQQIEDNIKDYAVKTYSSKIDSAIKGEEEKAAACIDLLKKELADNNATFEDYRKSIEDSVRNNALIEKLRKNAVGTIEASVDDMIKYFDDNAKTTNVSSFRSAFQSFITNSSKAVPLCIPHPEKAVEDNPDTTDTDESKEANPYGDIFSVQHVLIKFKNEAKDDDAKDLTAYAANDEEFMTKITEFEAKIPTLDTAQFLDECHNKDVCEDPGMLNPAYQFFGYMMQEELIDSYYDGFGYAAMKIRFGQDWEPKSEEKDDKEAASETAKPEEKKDYKVEYFTLTDGAQVAKVYSTTGAHYIIVNPNDCYCMYDADGYLMLPLYDGDTVRTKDGAIETAKGTMTQEQLDAVNAAFDFITKKAETNTDDTDENESEDQTEDQTEEETEVLDLKAIYDYYKGVREESMESEKYAEIFKQWKDSTSINVNRNLLAPYLNS